MLFLLSLDTPFIASWLDPQLRIQSQKQYCWYLYTVYMIYRADSYEYISFPEMKIVACIWLSGIHGWFSKNVTWWYESKDIQPTPHEKCNNAVMSHCDGFMQKQSNSRAAETLKQTYHPFDKIFITGCIRKIQLPVQSWKCCQKWHLHFNGWSFVMLTLLHQITYQWVSARLQYLQFISNGDIAVLL